MLRRVRKEDAILISDSVMTALLQMFSTTSGKSGGVQEDALLAVGTLVEGNLHTVTYLHVVNWPYRYLIILYVCIRQILVR